MTEGMSQPLFAAAFAIMGGIVSAIGTAFVMAWRGRGVIAELDAKIAGVESRMTASIAGIDTRVNGVELRANASIASVESRGVANVSNLKAEMKEMLEDFLRTQGESLSAIRQKMTDMELWNRDEFVRRSEHDKIIDSINRAMEAMGSKIEAGLNGIRAEMISGNDKLAAKIENLPH
jgi:hypothetical protein